MQLNAMHHCKRMEGGKDYFLEALHLYISDLKVENKYFFVECQYILDFSADDKQSLCNSE